MRYFQKKAEPTPLPDPSEVRAIFDESELSQGGLGQSKSDMLRAIFDEGELSQDVEDLEGQIRRSQKVLERGAKDSGPTGLVRKVQGLLVEHGHRIRVDGIFMDETANAVSEFQEKNNLNSTGKVDSDTLKALSEEPTLRPVSEEDRAERVGNNTSPTSNERLRRTPPEAQGNSPGPRAGGAVEADSAGSGDITGPRAGGPAFTAPGESQPADPVRLTSTSSGAVPPAALYSRLYASIKNKNLCKAMVANAIAESGIRPNVNGDCRAYGTRYRSKALDTSKYPDAFYKPRRGLCCSFGIWQYNICNGLGERLLRAYGVGVGSESTDAEKISVLTDYDKQVNFMINYVQKRIGPMLLSDEKTVDWWVEWFVVNVERPANMGSAIRKRQRIAQRLNIG